MIDDEVAAVTAILFVATICACFLKREYINLHNCYETLKEHVFISVLLYLISVIITYYVSWDIMPMVLHLTNPFVCIIYIFIYFLHFLYFILFVSVRAGVICKRYVLIIFNVIWKQYFYRAINV